MDMDYSLIAAKGINLFLISYILGIFTMFFFLEFDKFCSFICKLVRKYIRFYKIRKKLLKNN